MVFTLRNTLFAAALAAAGSGFAQQTIPRATLGPAPVHHANAIAPLNVQPSAPSGGFSVNMQSRESVRSFYNAVFSSADEREIGWTGNADTGVAGTTDTDFRESVRLRINCFRALAGVPSAVAFSETLHPKCQQAALMMSVNDDLQHEPPTTWTFYTAAGAEAAENSNLSLGDFGSDAVSGYMEDPGASNADVGHRRWLLYPQTQTMATGDVPSTPTAADPRRGANAVWVIDSNLGTTRPAVRDNFVAWPPPGYVPHTLIYPRWSFSLPAADFSSASVTLTKNGTNIPVVLEPITAGFGENTLVWVPQGQNPNDWQSGPPPAADQVYVVAVSGVKLSSITQPPYTYTVRGFNAAAPGPDTVEPTISGPASMTAGGTAEFDCAAVPGVSAYDWELAQLGAPTGTLNAQNGSLDIISHVSGYNLLASPTTAEAHYQLTTIDPSPQWFELASTYLPQTGATLRYKSRLGYMGTGQTARLQISTDDALTWNDVFTRTGDNGSGESAFVNRTVDLAAYVNRSIRVRFRYDYRPGYAGYFESAADVGWHVDDISFTNTERLGTKATTRTGTTFSASPTTPGTQILRVRPVHHGEYPGEWAPVRLLNVAAPSGTLNVVLAPPDGGTVTAGFLGTTQRPIGSSFRIVATPASGYFFNGWTGGLASANPALDFTMPASLSLTANFIPDELAAGAGTYAGLLADPPSTHAGAGVFSFTATPKGTFTGRVILGGKTTRFSGKLSPTGEARFGAAGSPTLALPQPFSFTVALGDGAVSGIVNGVAFSATRRHLGTTENPVPPAWLGIYTARLSASAPTSGRWPEGDGWARVVIASTGTVKINGSLADGTKLSTGGWLQTEGRFPVYLRLYGTKGSLAGRLSIANLAESDINAPLRWFRPTTSSTRFPDGWTNGLDCTLSGARYTQPAPPARVFSALDLLDGAATLRAEFGGISPALAWPISVAATTSKVTGARVSFTLRNGLFSSTFRDQSSGRTYTSKGVIIQKEQLATGFAPSPTGSVRVRILPAGL